MLGLSHIHTTRIEVTILRVSPVCCSPRNRQPRLPMGQHQGPGAAFQLRTCDPHKLLNMWLKQSKYPTLTTGNTFNGPESVTAHAPAGDSPFGVSDLVGETLTIWAYFYVCVSLLNTAPRPFLFTHSHSHSHQHSALYLLSR